MTDPLARAHVFLALVIAELTAPARVPFRLRALRRRRAWEELAEACRTGVPAATLTCAEAELEQTIRAGHTACSITDETYPELLRELNDPPPVLFVRGRYIPSYNVAIVGARSGSHGAQSVAQQLGESLASSGVLVVSGLALGIDGAAHTGAVGGAVSDTRSAGVGVLGSGLQHLFPPGHRSLAEQLVERGGCLVSELPHSTPPWPANFLRRNRLISGLSDLTVVVEAAARSGSLSTARHALEQGREVGAVPGPAGVSGCAGSNDLLRQGAHVILEPADVIRLAPPSKRRLLDPPHGAMPSAGSGDVPKPLRKVLQAVDAVNPTSFDRLVVVSGLGTTDLAEKLLELELRGLIHQAGSGIYLRNRDVRE